MKRKNSYIALLVLFLLKFSVSFAQIDTVFWFAAPWVTPDHTWRDPYKVHIAGNPGTVVRVRQPSAIAPNKYDTTFTLGASGFRDYTFWRDAGASATNIGYDSLEVKPANVVLPYGLKISANSNITVVYDVATRAPSFLNPETYSLKGQNALGTEFVCPFQTKWNTIVLGGDVNGDGITTQPRQQINIVATKSNTTVWITPRCAVVGHPANITYSVFLPSQGSAYTVQNLVANTTVAGNNLSGSIVTSDKDIAVTVSDDSVNGATGCYDLMGDQIVPVDIVGREYIVLKGKMNGPEPEGAFIVGTQNFTQININDGGVPTTTLINQGETFHYKTTQQLTYITASKNVYVLHGTGFGCELGEALLPPMDCGGSNDIRFSRNNTQRYFLNILCKTSIINNFILNGSPALVPASAFTVVPGTGGLYSGAQIEYSVAQIPVSSPTLSNLLSNTTSTNTVFSLGIYNGDLTTGNMYHYMSLFFRKTLVDATTPTAVCYGQTPTVALSGTVSGGATNGYWVTSNGTGTINPIYGSSSVYTIAPNDAPLDTILFTLISDKNCKGDSVMKTIKLPLKKPPVVSVGAGTVMCKNNISPVALTGTVTYGAGSWSGGNGGAFGVPGPNTTYTPSLADLAANTITLTLTGTSTLGCNSTVNTITVGFINPPVVSAGPNTVVCTNSQSLALNGSISGYTVGSWNTTGTGTFFPGSASPTGTYMLSASDLTLTNITFSLTYVPQLGDICASITNTMQVNVIAKPVVVAQNDFTVCSSLGVIPLNGNVSGSATQGVWTTTNGTGAFTQVPPSNATYTLSLNETLKDTVLVFVLGSTGGICPTATDTLKVSVVKPPSVLVNPNNQTVCKNAPIQLTGTVTGFVNGGTWSSTGTGSFSPNNQSLGGLYYPSAGDVSTGSVVIILTANTPSCGATNSFAAIFIPAPTALFNFPAYGKCLGNAINFTDASLLNGSPSLTYAWNFGELPGTITTAQNPIYTYTSSGSYTVALTVTGSNNCSDTIKRQVTVAPLPISNFSVTNACQGINSVFKDLSQSLPGGGYITAWTWQWGDAQPNITTGIPTTTVNHIYALPNQYVAALTISTNIGCTHTSTLAVDVTQKPDAEFGMTNNPIVAQEPVYFSDFSAPTGGIYQWYWQFGDESTSLNQAPSHSYQNAGIYIIKLTIVDNNGCSDTVSKSIEVSLLPQVPTAFTPNNDNNNDLLFVKGGPFEKMRFRVYDNWGVLLFETTDQKVGWDGKKNGIDQPLGVYVWTLEVDMYNNRQVKKNGDVTLIR